MNESYGQTVSWEPAAPKIGLLRLLVSLAVLSASVYVAAALTPGVSLDRPGASVVVALSLAVLNTLVPPALAALRLPFMVAIGFIAVLLLDAAHRRPRDHLPRDRRARPPGAAPRAARRQRAGDGALDLRPRLPPRGVGDRPVFADGCQPGGHPARLQ